MFNVGGGELLVIMLVALIVLGPQRLPDAARQVGRVMGDLRRISSGFQQELKDAFDDDDRQLPSRRKEAVPLASTVAEADSRKALAARRDGDGEDTTDGRATGAGDRGRTGATGTDHAPAVDPAVGAALDEIVTPLAPVPPVAADAAGATDASPQTGPGPQGDDGLGDTRAAS